MSRVRTPVVTSTLRLGTVVAICAVLLLVGATGAVAGQESVDVSIQPANETVEPGAETTLEVVVEGASSGVGAHDFEISLSNSDAANITGIEPVNEPGPVSQIRVTDGGASAEAVAAMGNNVYEAADEIPILELTVEGVTADAATDLNFTGRTDIGPAEGGTYSAISTTGGTLSVEAPSDDGGENGTDGGTGDDATDDGTGDDSTDDENGDNGTDGGGDGSGPGFGLLAGVTAVLAVALLARRRGRTNG